MRLIVTGTTGMVGEGVLLECLQNPKVEKVLSVSRKPYGASHPKLEELILPDFLEAGKFADRLAGYDACFFCAGISSAGMKEAEYTRITYDTTLEFARALVRVSPQATFVFVSGASTDSSEQGRTMWARVKGRTENALTKVGFARVYNFRPGFMKATPGQTRVKWYYGLIGWMYPLLKNFASNYASTLRDVALAMIYVAEHGYATTILEVRDINEVAKR